MSQFIDVDRSFSHFITIRPGKLPGSFIYEGSSYFCRKDPEQPLCEWIQNQSFYVLCLCNSVYYFSISTCRRCYYPLVEKHYMRPMQNLLHKLKSLKFIWFPGGYVICHDSGKSLSYVGFYVVFWLTTFL